MYKKLTAVRKMDDVQRIQDEFEDRYGDPPRPVWNLLALLRLRLRCHEVGISSVVAEKRRVALRFSGTHLTPEIIRKLSRAHMQHQFLPDIVFLATPDTPTRMLTAVEEMVEVLARALPPKAAPVRAAHPPLLGRREEASPEKNGTPRADKPKPAPAKKPPEPQGEDARARNLVSNQVSARRRGTYNTRGRG